MNGFFCCFELAFGLRVNIHKSIIIEMNIEDGFLEIVVGFFHVGMLLFNY